MSGYSIYVTVAEYYPLSNPNGFMGEAEIVAYITDNAVKSVNGQTGDVVIDFTEPLAQEIIDGTQIASQASYADYAAGADYAENANSANFANSSDNANNASFADVAGNAFTADNAGVTSVNGQTGDVTLSTGSTVPFVKVSGAGTAIANAAYGYFESDGVVTYRNGAGCSITNISTIDVTGSSVSTINGTYVESYDWYQNQNGWTYYHNGVGMVFSDGTNEYDSSSPEWPTSIGSATQKVVIKNQAGTILYQKVGTVYTGSYTVVSGSSPAPTATDITATPTPIPTVIGFDMSLNSQCEVSGFAGDIFIRLTGTVANFSILLPDADSMAGRRIYIFSSGTCGAISISGAGVGVVLPDIYGLSANDHFTLISDGRNYYQV
jgi:hypothetical protein